ncbi:MAG: NrdH-redoxin [Candidatus Cloacimonetes bacterium]|nr:NrdH-redoxin [Candidatus Cloacimonadota bacterium]MBL7087007.1 NrdH-redoxin [Candidatus Cloacimonadota bacterium]
MSNPFPKVIVFTSPYCSWCKRVKSYLQQKRIRFTEVDVTKNSSAARDIVRRTGQQGIPVTLVNNRPVIGFDKSKLDRLLGIR